jgi:citrate synthase
MDIVNQLSNEEQIRQHRESIKYQRSELRRVTNDLAQLGYRGSNLDLCAMQTFIQLVTRQAQIMVEIQNLYMYIAMIKKEDEKISYSEEEEANQQGLLEELLGVKE